MSSEISQEKLVGIAAAFAKAAINKTELEDRVIDAMEASGEDAFELLAMAMMLVDKKSKAEANAASNPEYAKAAFVTADKLASIFASVCTKAEINALLPADAKQPGVAAGFASQGAPNMAKLCA